VQGGLERKAKPVRAGLAHEGSLEKVPRSR
jgi:hypothetical protein